MNGATARRAAALVLLTVVLDPPITDWERFVAWMLGLLAVSSSPAPRSWHRLALAALICALALAGRYTLPRLHIEEAHQYFLPGPVEPVREWLPSPVLAALDGQFRARYPPEHWCEPEAGGCWRSALPPRDRFSFSADAFLRERQYSRVVSSVDFRGLGELRAGFTNRVETNWWDRTSDVRRRNLPFYVMYVLPAEAAGSTLCWRGDLWWEEAGGFRDLSDDRGACRAIEASDAGRRVFGISVLHQPLAIRLELTPSLAKARVAAQLAAVVGASAAVLVMLWPLSGWRALTFTLAAAAAAAVCMGPEALSSFMRYDPMQGGSDGIPYESYAHTILDRLEAGDLAEALKGVEASFFFMPGLRYFRAIEKAVFGETYLGYLAVLLLTPGVLLKFLRPFVPTLVMVGVWIAFLLPLTGADLFWWSFASYVDLARGGLAEPLAHVLWLGGTTLLLSGLLAEGNGRRSSMWGSFVLSLACLVRPNLLIASGLLLLLTSYRLWRTRGWREVGMVCLAFAPFAWVPLHNFLYAGRLELASRVIGPATLTPPAVYLQGIRELFSGAAAGPAVGRVSAQIALWIGSPVRALALGLSLLALLPCVPLANRALLLGLLGLHPLLLLWAPQGRYAHLAWQLTLVSAVANAAFLGIVAARQARPMLPQRLVSSGSGHLDTGEDCGGGGRNGGGPHGARGGIPRRRLPRRGAGRRRGPRSGAFLPSAGRAGVPRSRTSQEHRLHQPRDARRFHDGVCAAVPPGELARQAGERIVPRVSLRRDQQRRTGGILHLRHVPLAGRTGAAGRQTGRRAHHARSGRRCARAPDLRGARTVVAIPAAAPAEPP